MNVKLIDRKPTTIAYLRHVGPYGPELSRFWQETVYPWLASNRLLDRPRYGISLDDAGITAPEKCRYDAAVEVEPKLVTPGWRCSGIGCQAAVCSSTPDRCSSTTRPT